MRKRDIAKWIVYIVYWAAVAVIGYKVYSYFDWNDTNPDRYKIYEQEQTQLRCQYPVRPLNDDGTCDNTDPACPETIKIDGGNCNVEPLYEVKDGLSGK